jgi:hypothetical protein
VADHRDGAAAIACTGAAAAGGPDVSEAISERLPGHECNAYCRHPIHAETGWSHRPRPTPQEWQAQYARYAARVLSVAPAEMPPIVTRDGRLATYRYLITVKLEPLPPGPGWYPV